MSQPVKSRSRRQGALRRWLLPLVLIVAAGGAYAYFERPWEQRIASVEVEYVEPGPVSLVFAVNGRVAPRQKVEVRSAVSARVKSVEVVEGQSIAVGDVLLVLDDAQARAGVEQARAALEAGLVQEQLAQSNADRTAALGENVARSVREDAQLSLSAARNEVARLRAMLEQAESVLSQFVVMSPLDGVVLVRSVEAGQLADTQTVLLEIADVSKLHVEAAVDEIYAARIRDGLPALLLPAGQSIASHGTVNFAAPFVDLTTGGRDIRIGFDEPVDLPVGLTVNVNIIVETFDSALSVPRSALLTHGGTANVLVVHNETVVERTVEVIDWPADRLKIESGLEEGDAVILQPETVTVGQAATAVAS